MKSSYKKLGQYIREVDFRNIDDKKENLLGVSTQKVFIESIANTVGTDFKRYKIVKRNQFTYVPDTSRRGDRIGIAMLDSHDEAIVSQAYTVFEIHKPDELLPEYLMMWFRRPEFDRYARYMSHGSVREIFGWEEMCDVELPVPTPEKQRQIVDEYNTIVNRIKLNEELSKKLEETAQAIYKHWFVDFEFPISAEYAKSIGKPELEGKLYKSSGGEMVYNSDLDQEIPLGWGDGNLENIANLIDGDRGNNYPSEGDFIQAGFCIFLNTGNVTKNGFDFTNLNFINSEKDKVLRKGKLTKYDSVLTTRGTVGNSGFFNEIIEYENLRINSGMIIIRPKKIGVYAYFNYTLLKSTNMAQQINNFLSGSAQQHLPIKDIKLIKIVIPREEILIKANSHLKPIQDRIDSTNKFNRLILRTKDILLAKMTKVMC